MSKIISNQEKQKIVEYYKQQPVSLKIMSKKFGYCQSVISKILKENNCEIYQKNKIYNPNLNEDYFRCIDNEYKAYFLGLLLTDGNVYKNEKNNRQASIGLSFKYYDKYILDKFKEELNVNTLVTYCKRDNAYNINIRSDIMANDLAKYYIVPNKTKIARFPDIDSQYMIHFIRGILDGDGCISSHMGTNNKHSHYIQFCGTFDVVNNIKIQLNKFINNLSDSKIIYITDTFFEIKWSKIQDMKNIGDFLYNDAHIYFQRKYDIFKNFLEHYNL